MPADCLPCVICGSPLKNVFDGATNQPSEGTTFTSQGHYGSTAFDPMDGSHIELNICDPCLVEAGREHRLVYRGQNRRLVTAPAPPGSGMSQHPTIVGMQTLDEPKPLELWDPDTHYDDDRVQIVASEVGSPAIRGVQWSPGLENGWPT